MPVLKVHLLKITDPKEAVDQIKIQHFDQDRMNQSGLQEDLVPPPNYSQFDSMRNFQSHSQPTCFLSRQSQ